MNLSHSENTIGKLNILIHAIQRCEWLHFVKDAFPVQCILEPFQKLLGPLISKVCQGADITIGSAWQLLAVRRSFTV